MSTKAFESALDFLPEQRKSKLAVTVRIVIEAVRDGFAAARQYDRLVHRGVPAGEAAHEVFDRHYAG